MNLRSRREVAIIKTTESYGIVGFYPRTMESQLKADLMRRVKINGIPWQFRNLMESPAFDGLKNVNIRLIPKTREQ